MSESFYIVSRKLSADNIVKHVNVKAGRPFTDFGQGFYVTSNYEQAKDWSLQKYRMFSSSIEGVIPAIVKVHIDVTSLKQLSGLIFGEPDDKWAEFVYNCRQSLPLREDFFHGLPRRCQANFEVS